jgi:hypothetical protein
VTRTIERCDWSGLVVGECAHCRGDLGVDIEPDPRRFQETLPAAHRVWPPRKPEHEARAHRPRHRTPKPKNPCRWNTDLGWLTVEHRGECKGAECAGCKPCPKTHCAMRGSCPEHVETAAGITTCPGCIGRTRADLSSIVDLYALIPTEAQEVGIDSEAADLAGPAATPEQRAGRRAHGQVLDPDDEQHPYAVLGRWDMALRETQGPQTDLFVTVSRAADYLDGVLDGPFPHGDEFEDFASQVSRCRSHLEEVLTDSRRPEEGAPCPACREAGHDKPARLVKRYRDDDKTGAHDRWVCPDCSASWHEADYRLRIGGDFVAHAPALPARELADRLGVAVGTIRNWAASHKTYPIGKDAVVHPPLLKPSGRSADGRKTYLVEEAEALAARRVVAKVDQPGDGALTLRGTSAP